MSNSLTIRDLIYIDFDKLTSIASQFEDGLLQEIQSSTDKIRDIKGGIKVPLADLGGSVSDNTSRSEKRILHHDVLKKVEEALTNNGIVIDLNKEIAQSGPSIDNIHKTLTKASYIRAEGWVSLDDYQQINSFADVINDLYDFFGKSQREVIEQAPEILELRKQLNENEKTVKSTKDRNKKALLNQQLQTQKQQYETLIEGTIGYNKLPEWQLNGVKLLIQTLMTSDIKLRMYPFEEVPEFHLIANLKRNSFIDTNSNHLRYTYGSRPDIKLTLFGLITSIPPKDSHPFFGQKTSNQSKKTDDISQFEEVFQTLFDGLMSLEKYGRLVSYPNISIYPLAVYRTIHNTK